ncbi:MAG: DNA topoisomerase 4 subunit A [Bdellovibrionales bacterium]|nr:DNA topoisomerase 4 subunit A [Bdellovibrionales bacterium]
MAETETSLRKESRDRYLTYALSVVTGRALPDVRDGLKPVQRRILYAMYNNLKLRPAGSHRKSAAVVGEVLARYHPHGDTACYEAMVRMAQDFSLRYPLVDGQGNFGSLDGDGAAAYRYTEAKLLPLALEVLGEIDEETVEFRENFDSTTMEPEVLPSRVPHLLLNGATGIAVGMATSIPPHNLGELVKGLIELSKDPDMTASRLTTFIKGPDFPTGCSILNSKKELTEIYRTGRGAVRMRADWGLEELARGKQAIIISTVPYAVNKSQIVEKIADHIISKKLPQVIDVRDESTDTVRIVLELATGADPEIAMAYLYKNTNLESSFQVNLTAITPTENGAGKPELLSLKDCLQHFLDFRHEVVVRRLKFERRNLLERIHILEGLVIIYDALDEALKIVRSSTGRTDAATKLRKRFQLTEKQSFAVVDMRIYQLSKTNIADIKTELKDKQKRVDEIDAILKSKRRIASLVQKDLEDVVKQFSDKRRSKLVKDFVEVELNAADYVVQEEVYAIVTTDGWLKRIRQTNDLNSTRIREGDSIHRSHVVTTLDKVVFFTNLGYLYELPVSDFPSSSGYGSPVQKILKFRDGEMIVDSYAVIDEGSQEKQGELLGETPQHILKPGDTFILVTQKGMGYALEIEDIEGVKKNGKRVMKVRDGDALVALAPLDQSLSLFTQNGSGLTIVKKEIPVRNNPAVGVILMSVREGDRIVAAYSWKGKTRFRVHPVSGRPKEITASSITKGRRGLKGTKVLARGEIAAVECL